MWTRCRIIVNCNLHNVAYSSVNQPDTCPVDLPYPFFFFDKDRSHNKPPLDWRLLFQNILTIELEREIQNCHQFYLVESVKVGIGTYDIDRFVFKCFIKSRIYSILEAKSCWILYNKPIFLLWPFFFFIMDIE